MVSQLVAKGKGSVLGSLVLSDCWTMEEEKDESTIPGRIAVV